MSNIKEPNFFAFEDCPFDFEGPGAEFVNNSVASWDDMTRLRALIGRDLSHWMAA